MARTEGAPAIRTDTGAEGTAIRTAAAEKMNIEDVEFECVRSAIYNGARMHFLDRSHRWMMFVVIASGAATVASFLRPMGVLPEVFALVSTIIGAANIAFGFATRARDHDYLRRRYYELIAKLTEGRAEGDIAERIHCEMLRLTATEPPPLRALDAIAYNAALDGLGRDPAHRIPIRWWESALRHLYPFNGTNFVARAT